MSAISDRQRVIGKLSGLVLNLLKPIQVGVMLGQPNQYQPKIAIGVVFVGLGHMTDPLSAIDQAQALARKALREPSLILFEEAHPASFVPSSKSNRDAPR